MQYFHAVRHTALALGLFLAASCAMAQESRCHAGAGIIATGSNLGRLDFQEPVWVGSCDYAMEMSGNRRWETALGYMGHAYPAAFLGQSVIIPFTGHLDLMLGGAVLDRTTSSMGSHLNIHAGASLRLGKHLRLVFRHLSNAGLRSPNQGENMLLVDLRFK
ncbi:acyloxyacyl hydrolase [Ectothiorhodospira lacustris]|uniref:acyloxyacyl hydrolase n=1 Tax=Ectothiorhodospira lacustris TaxID=2899127 RepID=UPI001EE8EE92|nr:acyloxyacyl hydrolase [Ectothiorhodospira lacustris]MCG5499630.1 acyloxyacyl hydrolase [Ectothiorhodospira lacustris]MCG5509598.1 acyloxyacyl hydrolase [Ectothiorhodospira lacustris]MCG5521607.1 acyloxyacyl hydrolase [Ectothiorhodospira lacustris]